MSESPLELIDVRRAFAQGGARLEVLRGVSLDLRPGEMVALVGPSGAGKSTLLHIAGLLERPTDGEVRLAGARFGRRAGAGDDDDARTALRRRHLGFVYQFHHLLPDFSALDNLVLPQMIAGAKRPRARRRAGELLEMVGLAARALHRPAKLSGGEQQRVAIARALANSPKVLLADEPTGNLDRDTAQGVFELLVGIVREAGLAALIATHNLDLAQRMNRILALRDGRIADASH